MKKFNILFLVLSLLFSACDSFLEENPASNLVSEQFFGSEADAVAAINAVYDPLDGGAIFDGNINYMNSVETDEAERGQYGSASEDFYNAHNITTDDGVIASFWQANYIGINRANLVIKYVPEIEDIDSDVQARIIGEARFLRSLYYINLVMAFGDVPLVSEPTESLSDLDKERTPTAKVYELIEEDLKDAELALPASYSSSGDIGRPTSGAASALLARAYLYQDKFGDARTAALKVINSGNYSLFQDYGDLLLPEKKNGVEHIFSVQFLDGEVESAIGRYYGVNIVGGHPAIDIPFSLRGESSWQIERSFYNAFPETYRKRITFLPTEIPQYDNEGNLTDSFPIAPHTIKYRDPGKVNNNNEEGDNNFNVIRYGDVLLMFAEADNEVNGPTEEGVAALNLIRQRARGVGLEDEDDASVYPDIDEGEVTQSELRDIILDERKWELCFEGLRRWDLLRTDRYLDTFDDVTEKNLLFPIPLREITANSNLTQNSGY